MAAALIHLTTAPQKLLKEKAARLRDALREIETQMELPLDFMRTIYREVDKNTASQSRWAFVMLSPKQNAEVVDYLAEHSYRPVVALRVWATCFKHLHYETGEILLTRDELADHMHQEPRTISTIMSELEEFGAIIRHRQKIAGMKGRGMVRYFMNPNVATHLSGTQRDTVQRGAPSLKLVKGGLDANSSVAQN